MNIEYLIPNIRLICSPVFLEIQIRIRPTDFVAECLAVGGRCRDEALGQFGDGASEIGVRFEQFLNLLGVARNVGGDPQEPGGTQQDGQGIDKWWGEEPADLMFGLPPGVGKENMEGVDAGGAQYSGQGVACIIIRDPEVFKALLIGAGCDTTDEFSFHFEGEKVSMRVQSRPI